MLPLYSVSSRLDGRRQSIKGTPIVEWRDADSHKPSADFELSLLARIPSNNSGALAGLASRAPSSGGANSDKDSGEDQVFKDFRTKTTQAKAYLFQFRAVEPTVSTTITRASRRGGLLTRRPLRAPTPIKTPGRTRFELLTTYWSESTSSS